MTSINHGMPSRQPDENEPRDHTDRDILDFIDQTVTRITDADVNEHLREVLDQAGYRRRIPEAMIGYQRAHGHGGISAVGELAGQRLPASKAVMRLAVNAEYGRSSAGVNATTGTPRRPPAVPAIVHGRSVSRAVSSALDTSTSLAAPRLDLRAMNRSRREETRAMLAELRALLRQCPAGAFGAESSAMVLGRVAALSEALIADRDERAALRLIRAAFPHLVFLGRHPAAFKVRRAYAEAWCELGRYRRAEMLLGRLSADEERVFGSSDPRTALLLAWALVSSDRLREAETRFDALKARLAQSQVTSMPMLWHAQCRYSWLLGQQGLVSESEASYDGVIVNRSHELGPDHADTEDARHSKGKMRVVNGDGPRVITLLQGVADNRARVQGDRHPDTLETLKYLHLARVQAEPRDDRVLDRAIDDLERILHIQDKRHGSRYPTSHDTAEWLGRLLQLQESIRSGEPIPDLRQVPTPDEAQAGLCISAPYGTLTRLPER